MPESRRLEILEIAERFNILIIEDSPYREIRFEGKSQKTLFELDKTGRVIALYTFSKIFAPGMRLGWMLGHPGIIDKFIMAKQSADVCSPVLPQKIVAEYMKRGLIDKNLGKTLALYSHRKEVMLDCFNKYMPEGISWTKPEGGLFLFVTLPENLDADEVFLKAIENNVAFVKGSVFFCNDAGKNTMRVNFSYSGDELIREGIKRLAMVVTEMIKVPGKL
jgi:2-aminoadipate transaminase